MTAWIPLAFWVTVWVSGAYGTVRLVTRAVLAERDRRNGRGRP